MYVRREAIRNLAKVQDPTFENLFAQLINDSDSKVRYYAIKGLLEISSRSAHEIILEKLKMEQDPNVQRIMVDYLFSIRPDISLFQILLYPLKRNAKIKAIQALLNNFAFSQIDNRDYFVIVRNLALRDPDREVRSKALLLLSVFTKAFENEVLMVIDEVMKRELDVRIRESAAYLLSTVSKEKSLPWYKHYLAYEKNPTIVLELIKGIKRLGIQEDKDIEYLIVNIIREKQELIDRVPFKTIFYEAINILYKMNRALTEKILYEQLASENKYVRLHTLKAMILLDLDLRNRATKYLLKETDKAIKKEIISLLGDLKAVTSVDEIVALMIKEQSDIRSLIADVLVKIDGEIVIAAMRDLLVTQHDSEIQELAKRVLNRLIKGEPTYGIEHEERADLAFQIIPEGIRTIVDKRVFRTKSFPLYLIFAGAAIILLIYSPVNPIIIQSLILPYATQLLIFVTFAKFISGFAVVYMITSKLRTFTRILDKISRVHTLKISTTIISLIDIFVIIYIFTSFQDLLNILSTGFVFKIRFVAQTMDFLSLILLNAVMEAFGFLFFSYYIFRYGIKSLTKSAWTKDFFIDPIDTRTKLLRVSYLLFGLVVSYLLALIALVGDIPLITLGTNIGIIIGGSLFILHKRGLRGLITIWIILILAIILFT